MHYVCADIHGKWDKYAAMLHGLKLCGNDHLYILGDAIDRGTEGVRILQDIKSRGNISFFMGNHELLLYGSIRCGIEEWIELWLENGGRATAEAFLALPSKEQDDLLDFLENSYAAMPDLEVEGKHYYLVHAFPDLHYMDRPVLYSETTEHANRFWRMVWNRIDDELWNGGSTVPAVFEAGRKLLIGHTITTRFCRFNCDNQGHARIHHDKYFIGLDCGCARKGDLSCLGVLRLEDGKEFYY